MGTSDGISTKDWDIVHELAVEIANAPDSEKGHHRTRLLEYLNALELKYGPRPSISATRADYLDDEDPAREELLLLAYALAERRSDTPNLIYVAQSLAELYVDKRELPAANRWLGRMRKHLVARSDDADYSEYERIRAEYRKLAIKSITPPDN
jgi:hypothetical protein